MSDSVPQRIETLSAQLEGLETAARGLETDPSAGVSVRRIARSLQTAARGVDLDELAAGAGAIQKAADAHLARSVANFLARVAELRADAPIGMATVLVVEDDRTVAAATRAFLERAGSEVIVAENATQAEAVLADRDVDVVILDLILPDRDGRDLLVQMREQASTATTPVIVLSSSSGAVARAECMAVGADDFLEKPTEPATLRAAVRRQLDSGRERRDAIRDGVTDLPNRAGIRLEFEEQQRLAREGGTELSVAILALDSLAPITEKLGRDAGDRFLLEVCSAVREAIGKGDRLGRWETAELVAILPERTPDQAKRVLESTIRWLSDDKALNECREAGIEIALSGGIAAARPDQSLNDVISSAERSLYSAKASRAGVVHAEHDPLELDVKRVLVVEDDRVTGTLLHHRLVRDGHEVVDFENGKEAYAWIRDHDFDLAVLDVKVPGMDGFELLSRLRDIPRYADTPIIMLTGMGSEADVIRGLDLGADDYMLKPFSPSELLARVRRLLHAHREPAGGDPPDDRADPSSARGQEPEASAGAGPPRADAGGADGALSGARA